MTLPAALAALTRLPGVRGALVVSREDGLVVLDALMEGVDGAAVAALTASLAARLRGVTAALGQPEGQLFHLAATEGSLLAVPAAGDLLVVAVAGPDGNAGELRLALLAAAAEAGA